MHRGSRASRKNKKLLLWKISKVKWFYSLHTTAELEAEITKVQNQITDCSREEAIDVLLSPLRKYPEYAQAFRRQSELIILPDNIERCTMPA